MRSGVHPSVVRFSVSARALTRKLTTVTWPPEMGLGFRVKGLGSRV